MRNTIEKYFNLGNTLVVSGLIATLLAIAFAYFLADQMDLRIWHQVIAHLVIIISPGIIKIGYVIRLAAENTHSLDLKHCQ